MKKTTLLVTLLMLVALGLPAWAAPMSITAVHKTADGVTLKLGTGTLRLQVFSPRIIRVVYGEGERLPATRSLAVIGKPVRVHWDLIETNEEVRLRTSELEARVNRATGAVGFYDLAGKPVLVEKADGGKALTPNKIGELATLRSEQDFTLAPGEAVYGLGQHQQGLMNYRGTTVHLQQKNTEVAVPVLVSSGGYGLLWDNPVVTDVSAAASKEETIPAAQLYTEDSQPGGLTGQYYRGQNFDTLVTNRTDAGVNFDWSRTPPLDLPHDHYSVRWTGSIQAKQGGTYTLMATADDGVRVWIDDQLVIDDWTSRDVQTLTAKLNFAEHSRHRVRMDYYQDTYSAIARLAWRLPGDNSTLSWVSEAANSIDYYFMYGPDLDKVIAEYRDLTGAVPMFGKWAWGFWQCKERYQSQQEILGVVSRYRQSHIPIDGIIQDWQYWNPHPWGSHQFDTNRYPDAGKMLRDLHAENVHLLISVWPKFDVDSPNADELRRAGGLYAPVIPYVSPAGKGQWYDPFNPAARRIYWRQISQQLFALGVDGWWLDAPEPELSGKWGEYRGFSTAAGPGADVFNAYPLMHSTGVYEGQRADSSAKRAFILTRSAYAGQQRNAAVTWSGDIQGSWDVFAKQIPAGLNFAMSGIPYWNTDTGGFFGSGNLRGNPGNPGYQELFSRWFQFSAFCPMFRVHGTGRPKEMWRFDEATQKILENYDQLRYHLLPYIYSVSWKVTSEGGSMMRGLVMDFRQDTNVYDISDQYLFGPDLMVNPVTRVGATNRSVYLPGSVRWTDFWTGNSYPGGQSVDASAPIDTMPLFVRAGAVIPYGPSIEYATQSVDPIELRVYRGADGGFTLYEDENDNYDYEKGKYATIAFTWDEGRQTLAIGKRAGSFPGMLKERTFRIVWVASGHGSGIPVTEQADAIIHYTGKAVSISAVK